MTEKPSSPAETPQEDAPVDLTPKPTQRRDLHQEDSRWEADHKGCVLSAECDSLLFVTIDGIEWCAKCGANSINGRKGAVLIPAILREVERLRAKQPPSLLAVPDGKLRRILKETEEIRRSCLVLAMAIEHERDKRGSDYGPEAWSAEARRVVTAADELEAALAPLVAGKDADDPR